jgi:hypothetical protein
MGYNSAFKGLIHHNMGTLGGPNHINPTVQFCPQCTDITSATLRIALIIFAQRITVSSTDIL